jgi:hypothetical protein
MVNQCPFLFEALMQVNNNTFPFQQHLNATCDLLPPPTSSCLHLFEQFIGQQTVHLQDSISEHLHHHTLFNMLSNKIFEAHCVQIWSCSSLGASVWFIIWPIFLTFQSSSPIYLHNALDMIYTTTSCNYMPPSMCMHTFHWPYGYPLIYIALMAMNAWGPLLPLHEMLVFTWDENNYVCFL